MISGLHGPCSDDLTSSCSPRPSWWFPFFFALLLDLRVESLQILPSRVSLLLPFVGFAYKKEIYLEGSTLSFANANI